MKVVGLITEYNPFHNGHKYHIEEAKKLTGADYVVVVMSGNFVQRGTPAITDKYIRCEMALANGADLVIELPVVFSTASAEFFSYGAVRILDSLGIIDSICFGSECGDITLLEEVASLLCNEPDSYQILLNELLKKGLSFPAAREQALCTYMEQEHPERNHNNIQAVVSSPNNILGIEYIKALKRLHSPIKAATLQRVSANYHDTEVTSNISSATAIRKSMLTTEELACFLHAIPNTIHELVKQAYQKVMPITEDEISTLVFYKLLYTPKEDLCNFSDFNEDLAQRIKNCLPEYQNYSDFCDLLKTKNLTHARISRCLIHVLLDITKDTLQTAMLDTSCYIRILGMKKDSSFLLREAKKTCSVPIITKVGTAKQQLGEEAYLLFQKDLLASHLYNQLILEKFKYQQKDEYRIGIVLR